MQLAVRGTATSSNLRPGDDTSPLSMSLSTAGKWSGGGELTSPVPVGCGLGGCPNGGHSVAKLETLYATCSLEATDGHASEVYTTWQWGMGRVTRDSVQ
jgi:hypothetical protein